MSVMHTDGDTCVNVDLSLHGILISTFGFKQESAVHLAHLWTEWTALLGLKFSRCKVTSLLAEQNPVAQ